MFSHDFLLFAECKLLASHLLVLLLVSDNRMRPAPPGGRSQRTAIDVTRNPSSRDIKSSSVANGASALGKNLATEDQDSDLSSKIKYK